MFLVMVDDYSYGTCGSNLGPSTHSMMCDDGQSSMRCSSSDLMGVIILQSRFARSSGGASRSGNETWLKAELSCIGREWRTV